MPSNGSPKLPKAPKPPPRNPFLRWEKRLLQEAARGIATPDGRRAAIYHANLFDHAFLRHHWTNEFEFAPGVWRSNQPGPRRIADYARRGIRTILNLRGPGEWSTTIFEREACAKAGIELLFVRLKAKALARRETLLELVDVMRDAQRPLLIHCKSGADRTGLAAALHLIANENRSVEEAMAQLHWRYWHFRFSPTGVLDHLVRRYGEAQAATGVSLRDWLANAYDPAEITADWRARRRGW